MEGFCGARNTQGFTSAIQQGQLPPINHITYQGLFNELKYNIGSKTDKIIDIHHGFSRFKFQQSQNDASMNDYLAVFFKSKADGEESTETKINSIICLDISGSMSSQISHKQEGKSRLSLSIQAIRIFISKLKPYDTFGLVIFNTSATVFLKSIQKRNINDEILNSFDSIAAKGGTIIRNGLVQCQKLLLELTSNKKQNEYVQNRIIMLTDVCDDSFKNERIYLNTMADKNNIHLTIVGISDQFKSQICQQFTQIKGFNYFCAVKNQDLVNYIQKTFVSGFFPNALNVKLTLYSDNLKKIKVFGTPDSSQINYKNIIDKDGGFLITSVKSIFPCQIQTINGVMYTIGGLVLIKIQRQGNNNQFNGTLSLQYDDLAGKHHTQDYQIEYNFHAEQQFFSGDDLREAIQGYIFVSEIKNIIQIANKTNDKNKIYEKFIYLINKLEPICPKNKINDYKNIKKIIQGYKKKQKKQVKYFEQ